MSSVFPRCSLRTGVEGLEVQGCYAKAVHGSRDSFISMSMSIDVQDVHTNFVFLSAWKDKLSPKKKKKRDKVH